MRFADEPIRHLFRGAGRLSGRHLGFGHGGPGHAAGVRQLPVTIGMLVLNLSVVLPLRDRRRLLVPSAD